MAGIGAVAGARAGLSRRTRNQVAYSAGTKTRVSAVATTRPPMIEMAIGPQKTLRVSGIMASPGEERRRVRRSVLGWGDETPAL